MSLTPLHLAPGLLLGVFTLRFFNLWALLLGSVIPDIEPLVLLIINSCYSCYHHGFLHSILGAIFGSLILGIILSKLKTRLNKFSLKFGINQPFSYQILFFSSFFAWLIHIFLDNFTHFDVFPFWPSNLKPLFFGRKIYWLLNLILLVFGIIGLILIHRKIKKSKKYAVT